MKRIICTVTTDLNFDQRMIRICTSLVQAGYDVLLVGRVLKQSPALQFQPFRQKRMQCFFESGKLFYLEYNFRLFLYLLFAPYDVVCSIDLDTILPGFFVSKIKGKACVYDAHEYFAELPEVVERPRVKKAWEAVAQLVIPRIRYAYTVCDSLAEIFYKKYKTPFVVIRNVPLRIQQPEQKEIAASPLILIYQGVLNEGRGLEETIEAMDQMEDVVCWLVGEGDLSERLRKMVVDKGLQNKILFHGRVAPPELLALTKRAHIGLNMLKKKGLNYYFSLANKTFDYMQAGIPSICMNFPEYSRLHDKYGTFLLLEELTPTAIIEAVNRLREEDGYYQKLVGRNRIAAKDLTWGKEKEKLLVFYEEVFINISGPNHY